VAIELSKAIRKTWWIAGHNDDEEDNYDDNSNCEPLETSLGYVKHKRSTTPMGKCFTCGKKDHKELACSLKKRKVIQGCSCDKLYQV
jgi:hypothetical protein